MRNKKAGLSGEDMLVRLTLLQIAAALITGTVFFAVYKLNAGLFSELRDGFIELMAEDKDVNELIPYHFMQEETTETTMPPEETSETTETESVFYGSGGEDTALPEETGTVNASANGLPQAVMPVNGTYSSAYGSRIHPIYGTPGFHGGTDIAAPEDTPILAALDGIVTECGTGEMSGNYVKLDNGGGIETLYCHCREINVQKGECVKKGDVIAFVGQTGLATGPHLHFELHLDGVKCDPMLLLESAVNVS